MENDDKKTTVEFSLPHLLSAKGIRPFGVTSHPWPIFQISYVSKIGENSHHELFYRHQILYSKVCTYLL
jgi:hypothetical protein